MSNLTDALARVGFSEALGKRLAHEEDRLRILRKRREESDQALKLARAVPNPGLFNEYLAGVQAELHADAAGVVRRHVGTITLTPKDENPGRFYEATGALKLLFPSTDAPVNGSDSCGGAHWSLTATSIPYLVRLPSSRKAA